MKKHSLVQAALAIVFALLAAPLAAAELIMLEQPGCPWCARFNAEIAPAYANTEEGRQAPLRRVDITQEWPEDLTGIRSERFTPTFILVDEGREVGRMHGYPGDEFFWYLLNELIAKMGAEKSQ